VAAFANLKKICEEYLAGEYQIEVIDLMEHPELARTEGKVLAARWPAPARRRASGLPRLHLCVSRSGAAYGSCNARFALCPKTWAASRPASQFRSWRPTSPIRVVLKCTTATNTRSSGRYFSRGSPLPRILGNAVWSPNNLHALSITKCQKAIYVSPTT
jgi:hypothetical protein